MELGVLRVPVQYLTVLSRFLGNTEQQLIQQSLLAGGLGEEEEGSSWYDNYYNYKDDGNAGELASSSFSRAAVFRRRMYDDKEPSSWSSSSWYSWFHDDGDDEQYTDNSYLQQYTDGSSSYHRSLLENHPVYDGSTIGDSVDGKNSGASAGDAASSILSNIFLFFLVFGLSATVDISDLKRQLGNQFAIGCGIAMQFVIMPFLGYLSVIVFRNLGSKSDDGEHTFTEAMGITLLVVTSSPGGSFSNWWCNLFNADLALSVAMTTVSSILSIAMLPANLFLYTFLAYGDATSSTSTSPDDDEIDTDTDTDPNTTPLNTSNTTFILEKEAESVLEALDFNTLFITLGVVLFAIVSGIWCGNHWDSPQFHIMANRFASISGLLLILFSIFLSSGGSGGEDSNFWNHDWVFYMAVASPCLFGIVLANVISRSVNLSPPETVAIAIECCYQNTGIATAVAISMFRTDDKQKAEAVAVPLFYGFVEAVAIGIYCVLAWKMGWTKAPADERLCVILGKTYEVTAQHEQDEDGDAHNDDVDAFDVADQQGSPSHHHATQVDSTGDKKNIVRASAAPTTVSGDLEMPPRSTANGLYDSDDNFKDETKSIPATDNNRKNNQQQRTGGFMSGFIPPVFRRLADGLFARTETTSSNVASGSALHRHPSDKKVVDDNEKDPSDHPQHHSAHDNDDDRVGALPISGSNPTTTTTTTSCSDDDTRSRLVSADGTVDTSLASLASGNGSAGNGAPSPASIGVMTVDYDQPSPTSSHEQQQHQQVVVPPQSPSRQQQQQQQQHPQQQMDFERKPPLMNQSGELLPPLEATTASAMVGMATSSPLRRKEEEQEVVSDIGVVVAAVSNNNSNNGEVDDDDEEVGGAGETYYDEVPTSTNTAEPSTTTTTSAHYFA